MIPTNPTRGADVHSGASTTGNPNANPIYGATTGNPAASQNVNQPSRANVNPGALESANANANTNNFANGFPHGFPHDNPHGKPHVNPTGEQSVNSQEEPQKRSRSFVYDPRPALTLQIMGKFAVDAARGTYVEQEEPAAAIASFYNAVFNFLEELIFHKADAASFLLRMVRPFLEAPTTTQKDREEGWSLVRGLIKNMMTLIDDQSLYNVSATATQWFPEYRLFL